MPKYYYFTRYRSMLRTYRRYVKKIGILIGVVCTIPILYSISPELLKSSAKNALAQNEIVAIQSMHNTINYPKFLWATSFRDYRNVNNTTGFTEYINSNENTVQEIIVYDGKKSCYFVRDNTVIVTDTPKKSEQTEQENHSELLETMAQNYTFERLRQEYFVVDPSTCFPEGITTVDELLRMNLTLQKKEAPQILIFHTHSSEAYADSRPGVEDDTVVGVGSYLAKLLEDKGYKVIHDKSPYDKKDGKVNRNVSYSQALKGLEKVLNKYPSIDVIIDLHRDSGEARRTTINGENSAQIMLFNGMSRTAEAPIDYLPNENLPANLAFSLQLKITGDNMYPGYMKRNYLKSYRYNMHLRPRDMLIEVGTGKNTVAEAYQAMIPFSEILDTVLSGTY